MKGPADRKSAGSRPGVSRAVRDLLIVSLVTLMAFFIVHSLDVSGRMDVLVQKIGMMGLHDVFVTTLVLVVSLAVYSLRRWKESSRAREELHRHQERLEYIVEERTAELRKVNEELEEEIAERKQAEAALKESEEQFRGIASAASDAIIHMDNDGRIAYWNPAAEKMFGHTAEEAMGKVLHFLLSPERYYEAFESGFARFKETGKGPVVGKTLEMEAVRKDGTEFPIEVSLSPVHVKGRWHAVGIIRDISGRRRAEEAIRKSEKFLDTIFHSIHDPFSIIDRDFRIVRVNEAYAQMRSIPADKLIGRKCFEILQESNMVCENCIVEKTFSSGDPCAKEKLCDLHGEGEMWVEILTHPIMDAGGGVSHVIEYIRDITARKKADEDNVRLIRELERISKTDVLTGLMNRRAIIGVLASEMERSRRYGSALSLLLCDIDYFKDINDAYGHEAGDKALVFIAGALGGMARNIDLIGRYGGDEFMLVLPETGVSGAMDLARRILETIKETEVRLYEGGSFHISMSVGITSFRVDDDTDGLIRRADKALYSSKRSGRNRITVEE